MKKHFVDNNDRISIRNKVIGLGEKSFHKNYYKTLKHSVEELELFRTVLEEISDILIVIDEKENILDLNKAAIRFIGVESRDIKGASIQLFEKLQYLKLSHNSNDSIQIDDMDEEGKEKNFFFSLKKVSISGSNYKVLIGKDVSLLIQSQKEQDRANEQLFQIQKVETVGQLAGGIAHDFNNILTSIIGAASLISLNREQDLVPMNKKYVEMILESSHNAAGLVSKLMSISRRGKSSAEIFSFSDLIGVTIEILRHTVDKNIEILFEDSAISPLILGDKSRFHSLLLNLGVNASHAIHGEGSILFKLSNSYLSNEYCSQSLFSIVPGEYLKLEVRDTGEGIPESVLANIFDIFFTTKKMGKGSGLGLSSVMKTVTDHKGEILVESISGKGATFTLYIPVENNDRKQVLPKKEIVNGSETILLVDDETFNRDLGYEILHSLGYEVFLASNGLEAVQIYKNPKNSIDLIILDMNMPVMDGSEAYSRLKKMNPAVKILITTGNLYNRKVQDMRDSGVTDIIVKPYSIEEFSFKIREILERAL